MELNSILFFLAFMIVIILVLCVCTFPFALMINKQFVKCRKTKVLLYVFGFNVIYNILFIFSHLVAVEVTRILSYYLGIIAMMFTVSVAYWFIEIILWMFKKRELLDLKYVKHSFVFVFVFLVILSIYNFEKPLAVEKFEIESDKLDKSYRFVHISDIQYGTVSKEYMNDVLDLAISQNPDFIVITGDLIDFEKYEQTDFDKFKTLPVPVYFERGNHEFYHFPDKIFKYLSDIETVTVLDNKKINFEGIEIVGIDFDNSNRYFKEYLSEFELDENKYSMLLYHSPLDVEFAAGYGFDLLLYGHTHGGQIFPATLIVDMIYDYPGGFYEIFDTKVYVTDGAGLWGPKMRLGSQNEIAVFDLIKVE
ncbi:MAG: metallophosphoesterase [Nanoarchaeales archaeon]|nr:metallophosphoesterase [Nanoarchaeales archaeon]